MKDSKEPASVVDPPEAGLLKMGPFSGSSLQAEEKTKKHNNNNNNNNNASKNNH